MNKARVPDDYERLWLDRLERGFVAFQAGSRWKVGKGRNEWYWLASASVFWRLQDERWIKRTSAGSAYWTITVAGKRALARKRYRK